MDNLTSTHTNDLATCTHHACATARTAHPVLFVPPRDVWSNDPDRTTRRGDTQSIVAREAAQLTPAELVALDAEVCRTCGGLGDRHHVLPHPTRPGYVQPCPELWRTR